MNDSLFKNKKVREYFLRRGDIPMYAENEKHFQYFPKDENGQEYYITDYNKSESYPLDITQKEIYLKRRRDNLNFNELRINPKRIREDFESVDICALFLDQVTYYARDKNNQQYYPKFYLPNN